MKKNQRLLAIVGLLAVSVAGCGTGEAEEAPSLQTVSVARGDLRIVAEATGTVEPIRTVEVKSKAGGEILRLHADVGDAVAPGTLLAEVDPRDVRNQYDQAVADLEVAQARADIAQAQLSRSQELHASGVITDQEFENARLDQSNAHASLIKAQTNKELAEVRLQDVTIRAPMAGTILTKNVEEGSVIQSASQNVSGGTALFLMASLDEMQVRTLVDETDMGEIRPNMPSTVTVEAYPDRVFEGRVLKVEPQAVVQQNVTMFPVIIALENRGGLLKPGMNAEVEILIDQATDVLVVPNNALVLAQDVQPAMMALGLDPQDYDMSLFRGGSRFGGGRAGANGARPAGGAAAAGEAGRGAPGGVAPGDPGAAGRRGGGNADFQRLREQVASGAISQDSVRALMQAARQRGGFGARGEQEGAPARQTRRAAVFVVDSTGTITPTPVEIGLNDWDVTQVVSGVDEGVHVAIIGAAQLQQQQQEFLNRMRGRSANPFGGRR